MYGIILFRVKFWSITVIFFIPLITSRFTLSGLQVNYFNSESHLKHMWHVFCSLHGPLFAISFEMLYIIVVFRLPHSNLRPSSCPPSFELQISFFIKFRGSSCKPHCCSSIFVVPQLQVSSEKEIRVWKWVEARPHKLTTQVEWVYPYVNVMNQ